MHEIKNYNPHMKYRRFGKTNNELSFITLGGMRYDKGWEEPRTEFSKKSIEECIECTTLSFKSGINMIETAHGYGRSEGLYSKVLN